MTVAELRAAVATRVALLEGWTESKAIPELFGQDPASIAHLAFAVALPTTDRVDPRQRGATYVRTKLVIRFSTRGQPKDAVAATTAQLAAEAALMAQLLESSPTWPNAGFHLVFEDIERSATPEGEWLRSDVSFTATHTVPL